MDKEYDIAFLGGGPAGYQGAIRAAQLGAKTAVVEEKFIGGVCLNLGLHSDQDREGFRRNWPLHAPGKRVWIQAG